MKTSYGIHGVRGVCGNLRARSRSAIAGGCLMVLAFWTGAVAQFVSTGNGYSATHASGTTITEWTSYGSRGGWSVTTDNSKTGVFPAQNTSQQGFLILNSATYTCSNDGEYTATFGMANHTSETWNFGSGAVVFRYGGQTAFYAVRVHYTNGTTHKVIFAKNVLNKADVQSGERELGTMSATLGDPITLTIKLRGDSITVYNGTSTSGTRIGNTIIDSDNPSGQVGYAQADQYQRGAVFYGSSWTGADPIAESVPPGYTNYMVWNTADAKTFTPGSGAWGGQNWSPDSSTVRVNWINGRSALFLGGAVGSSYTVTAASHQTGNLDFKSDYTITGGTLTGAAARTITVDAAKSVSMGSILAGAASPLTKAGAGTLTLNRSSTYTGGTIVSAGILAIDSSASLGGSAGGTVTIGGGATLRISGSNNVTVPNAITMNNGSKIDGAGAVSGALSLNGSDTVAVGSSFGIDGVITGTGSLVKTGAGALTLTGANAFSGTTAVNAGQLQIGSGAAGSLTNSNITLAAGTRVRFNRTGTVTHSGSISGAGNLVKDGSGTLILTGANTGHTGVDSINGGVLEVATSANIGGGTGAIIVASGAALRFSNTESQTFARTITGASAYFEKTGAGALSLTGAGMSVGRVVVSGGSLNVDYTGSLAADSIAVSGSGTKLVSGNLGKDDIKNITVNTGAVLSVPSSATSPIYRNNVILGVGASGTGTLEQLSAGTLQINGNLTMTANSQIELNLQSGWKTKTSISGIGNVTLNGTLNLKKGGALTDADVGTYNIITAGGTLSGKFSTITVDGNEPGAYTITQNVAAKGVTIAIEKKSTVDFSAYNPLRVESAVFVSANATGSTVTVSVSGFNELRPYNISGAPRVSAAYILYKPGTGATTPTDTTVNGGRYAIDLSSFPTTDVKEFTVTVPTSKGSRDTLYFFNAGVEWTLATGTERPNPAPSGAGAKSAYMLDPRSAVLANEFKVSVADYTSENTGVTFELAITGQSDAKLTPGVNYKPSVDSVAVWFKRTTAPAFVGNNNGLNKSSVGADSILVYSLAQLRSNGRITFKTRAVTDPTAETVYFAVAPRWKGVGVDSLARPLYSVSQSVPNPTKTLPNNPVQLSAVQEDKRVNEVTITVGVSEAFNEEAKNVRIEFAFDQSMTETIAISKNLFTVSEVAAGLTFTVSNDGFVGAERSVYYKITALGDGVTGGVERVSTFTVGRAAPTAPSGVAFTPLGGGNGELRWNRVTPAANNIGDNVEQSKIYIYYGTEQPSVSGAPNLIVSASVTEVNLSGLTPETDYGFAVVLEDVVDATKPSWNLKSAAARITENSGPDYVALNIVKIDTVFFDAASSIFKVVYSLTENKVAHKLDYVVAYDQAGDYVVLEGDGTIAKSSAGDVDTLRISLGSALKFETTYWFRLRTLDGAGNAGAGWSVKEADVGRFSKQVITVINDADPVKNSQNTDYVNNGKFGVSTVEWSSGLGNVSCQTTISLNNDAGGNMSDFEYCGDGYQYSVNAGAGFNDILPPFTILMKANEDGIPSAYTEKDALIYRWTGVSWEYVATKYENGYFIGTAGDSAYIDGGTYRLLINTMRPVVWNGNRQLNGTLELPAVNTSTPYAIDEEFIIETNVSNFSTKLIYAPAKDDSPNFSLASAQNRMGKGSAKQTWKFTVDNNVIHESENYGILAYLIVFDGRNADTINLSRSVMSDKYNGFPVVSSGNKWLPFAAQVDLKQKSVKDAIKSSTQLYPDGEYVRYDTLFRLFRYYENDSTKYTNQKWVEYRDDGRHDKDFALEPGRLLWYKSSVTASFNFGQATTVSLVKPFEIELPPNQWTDFVVPFSFNICVGDVLAATNAADLEIYKWGAPTDKKSKYNYVAQSIALTGIDNIDSSKTLNGGDDPFTIFNGSNSAVVLKIPPRPVSMSRYGAGASKSLAKTSGGNESGIWYYTLRAHTDNSPELSDVTVGYNSSKRVFAVPPSFNSESITLIDASGLEMGHYFGPELATKGGTFKLRFYNDAKRKSTFTFTALPSGFIPSGTKVTFVNAVSGAEITPINSEYGVSVAGMSYQDVYMVVGAPEYQTKLGIGSSAVKFAVGPVMVNQAARSVKIKYYIPLAGVDRVEMSVYDIKGRLAWKNSERARSSSWSVMEWKSRDSRRGAAAAGLYIIRVRAIDARGKTAAVINKRVTFSR